MKWFGNIAYAVTSETSPGVWTESYEVRPYYGDLVRFSRRLDESSISTNNNVSVSNEISVVADPYAYNNFHNIRWADFMGAKWTVTSVSVQPPRLVLTLGGVYNAETPC